MKQLNDQYFNYRQTPVEFDGVAKPSIKGNTLVWNQLCNDTTGQLRCTVTVSNHVFTITENRTEENATFVFRLTNIFVPTGHKVLVLGNFVSQTVTGFSKIGIIFVDNGYYSASNSYDVTSIGNFGNIFTTTKDTARLQFTFSGTSKTGTTDNAVLSNIVVFDLTKMFGSGNEPTTVEEFTSLFPLSYYAYDSGSLLNFTGTGIKTTGKNLSVPFTTETKNGITLTADNNEVTLNGTATSNAFFSSSFVLPSGSYIVSLNNDVATSNVHIYFHTIDGSDIADNNLNTVNKTFTYTTNNPTNRCTLYVISGATLNNFKIKLQTEFGSTATSYEPYTSSILSLPISTYFPTEMKSAGTGTGRVYDELSDKAITRVGEIQLTGDMEWHRTPANNFWVQFNSMARSNNYSLMTTCNTLQPLETGAVDSTTSDYPRWVAGYAKNSSYPNQNFLYIHIDGVTTVEDLGTWLTNNPTTLNYELATYTEQDVDPIYYNFYVNGTEELLPVNTDTPTTSPLLADIIYYTVSDSEVPYRVFWAINSKGERWDFTEREFKSFMNNPQGLGFSKTISVNRYGNAQSLTDITDNFPQPNGEILFYDSSNSTRYDKYNQFVKFLSYEPITLYYKIPVSYYSRIPNTYSIECVVGTLTKTESKTDNILNCSITFNALSFYKGEEVVINGAIAGTGYFHVKNDGDFPVGFEIMATGSVSNPVVTLKQDDELYGEAKFIDATAFSKVYIDSNDGEQNLILEQGGSAVPNPMSYQDLSISNGSIYVTFIKLARGESTIMIDGTAGSFTSATIRFTPIYRSV